MPINNERFVSIFSEICESCIKILEDKGQDYSDADNDRLSNFKEVGNLLGVSAKEVWAVYFLKHIFAILTWASGKELQSESLRGRVEDAINYLVLGYALWIEENEQNIKQEGGETIEKYISDAKRIYGTCACGDGCSDNS